MNDREKSDGFVVPKKLPNKGRGAPRPAEAVEERDPAKRNPREQTRSRAQDRTELQQSLDRIRQVAQRDEEVKFTRTGCATQTCGVVAIDHEWLLNVEHRTEGRHVNCAPPPLPASLSVATPARLTRGRSRMR